MKEKKIKHRIVCMLIIALVVLLISICVGRFWISPGTMLRVVLSRMISVQETWSSQVETILFQVRFPRIILGILVGAGLSCAGATYQGIFQNPLVSPDILGASWGAGFGAALGLFCSFGYIGVSVSAFSFGILAVLIVCMIGKLMHNNHMLGFILGGIMVGSMFQAGVSFLKLVADPMNTLPAITYWLMGSLASARQSDVLFAAVPIVIGIIPMILYRWKLNVLTMGTDEAKAMGINVRQLQFILIGAATLVTAAAVSVTGMIGWVGLVIPHVTRLLVGSDYRKVIPVSMLLGSTYLLLVDDVARMITTSEIPLGILTAFVGAPFFLYLILKEGKQL
ncbi:MAG: iron ABC transporter permease [Lachnospiraceae bacterium]